MEYIKLGKSNLEVSRLCLGCMSFSDNTKGQHQEVLNQEQTDDIVKYALDLGINFFGTANCYSDGTSEIYLGNALRKYTEHSDVIIATKVYFNEGKLSYDAIASFDLKLTEEDIAYLEELYLPHKVVGALYE